MFATLLGALPRPTVDANGEPAGPSAPRDPDADVIEDLIATAIRAQESAGLEPVTDGRLRDPQFERLGARLVARAIGRERIRDVDIAATVDAWRTAAALTDRAVKQALPGPYSLARRWANAHRSLAALDLAAALRAEVDALAAAGCPLVEIEETEAHQIGTDERERARFVDAHRVLTEGLTGTHLSLSIAGGAAWEAGLETVDAAGYASLAVDVIAGPDNWNLVTRLPRERGVVVGALPAAATPADAKEVLLWAARYAAGSNGRGLDRVGIGSAGSWANLTWGAALRKLERLGEGARIAAVPGGEELARSIDPRAVNARAAALGHVAPRRRRSR